MLISQQHHVNTFKQLVTLINAYVNQGLKIGRINVATVLDANTSFAATWSVSGRAYAWDMDDILQGVASIEVMEELVTSGPNTMRGAIYSGRMRHDPKTDATDDEKGGDPQ